MVEKVNSGFIKNEKIVLLMDASIISCFILIFVLSIPRFIARFRHRSDSLGSSLLLSERSILARRQSEPKQTTGTYRSSNNNRLESPPATPIDKEEKERDDPSTETSVNNLDSNTSSHQILHIPSFSSLLYPVSLPFSLTIFQSFSLGKLLILITLTAICLLVIFIASGNPFDDPKRLGWMAAAYLPLTVALGTKNNLVGVLLGVSYERVNFLHRWIGTASFVTANLHMISYIYVWVNEKKLTLTEHFHKPMNIHGLIALLGIELLFFASLPFVRKRWYTVFLFCHVVGCALFISFLAYHLSQYMLFYWSISAVSIWAFDHGLRLIKTRLTVARVSVISSLNSVRVELPSIKSGWNAGQHVRLRILSSEMGILGWTVAYPFTVANVPGMGGETGMVLIVKKAGAWTSGLYYLGSQSDNERGTTGRDVRIIVEGPYGGLGNMVMSSFTSVLLIGGGSGVTFVLGQAEELVWDIINGRSSVRFVNVIWITQEQFSVAGLIPSFYSILERLPTSYGVFMSISIYYTRASLDPDSASETNRPRLSARLSISPGRPSIPDALNHLAQSASSSPNPRGVAVGVCGPTELIHDIQRCVNNIKSGIRRSCGGVELHDESFEW